MFLMRFQIYRNSTTVRARQLSHLIQLLIQLRRHNKGFLILYNILARRNAWRFYCAKQSASNVNLLGVPYIIPDRRYFSTTRLILVKALQTNRVKGNLSRCVFFNPVPVSLFAPYLQNWNEFVKVCSLLPSASQGKRLSLLLQLGKLSRYPGLHTLKNNLCL